MTAVGESYRYCRGVARSRAKNFYYSFLLLSRQQRKAMCAIYAFMRHCDDLSDEPGSTRAGLEGWRAEMEEALEGRFSGHPIWPAFHHTVRRFGIPHQYMRDMLDGVTGDLEPRRFETFDQLYRYCYQVASVVGLTIIRIFGFDTPSALPLAIALIIRSTSTPALSPSVIASAVAAMLMATSRLLTSLTLLAAPNGPK